MPASAVPVPASPVSVKLSTYDGKTNWEVYKTQFCIISEANGWTERVKACHNLRFSQKYSKDYARLQKTGESLQEYASEVERLANLAFSDPPATVREVISLQYFVDGLKEGEIQKAVRMADVQDLKSALLYALKLEAATQASRKDFFSIRGARVIGDEPCEFRLIKEMEKLKEEMQTIKAGISNQEKRNFKCWGCGGTGHLRINCPQSRKEENNITAVNSGDKGLYVIVQINNISCRRVVDTGVNVSIIRKDLAQNSQLSIIWTPPCVSFQKVTGDKINVHGTECIIPGLVAENRKFRFGLIDYPDPDNSKGGVLIALSIVDLSKSVLPVRVANISDRKRTIQEGEVIAACAPVTCVDRKCNSQDHSSDDLVKNLLQNIDLDKKQRFARCRRADYRIPKRIFKNI
ncbi:retrovirus-related Pol polyprotein from transposon 412 [Trichonephila clavipes]|nr:retrovirus-related Pol polyprotein from transposon 412 [Trichonephila clavipes]